MNGLRLQRLCVLAILLIGINQTSQAVTVCKDGSCDHTSIKAALEDNAHNGENVFVKPDTYNESDLQVGGTTQGGARVLTSTQPNNSNVIIDATESGNKVIACLSGGSKLIGLTLRGGTRGVSLCGGGDVLLSNLIVEDNITAGEGGGLYALWGPVDIIDSTFRKNRASNGGAIAFGSDGILRILGSTFINNTASGGRVKGGAIVGGPDATLLIVNSVFSGNEALGSMTSYGGAISIAKVATLKNCSFTNNVAQGDWLVPGSIGYGGAIYKSNAGLLDIIGGSVTGNQSGQGGGIAFFVGSAKFQSSASITGNEAMRGGANDGGGIYCGSANQILNLQGTVTGNIVDDISCRPAEGLPTEPTDDTSESKKQSGEINDPISTFNGELYKRYAPDLFLGGPLPLHFSRYYASRLLTSNINGSLGDNWRHNYEWTLLRIGAEVSIANNRGRLIEFIENGESWNLTGNMDIVYQLSENAGIFTLLDPGSGRLYSFNSFGRLTEIYDSNGNVNTLNYNDEGLLSNVSDGLGRVLAFTYGVDGRLDKVSDGTRFVSFAHIGENLTDVTDALGNTSIYTYTVNGRIIDQTQPEGNIPFTQSWSEDRVITQTNSDGHTTNIDYSGLETTITDPLGDIRIHTHTATGEFSNREDQNSLSFSMGSDATGRRNSLTDRLGDTTTIDYNNDSGDVELVTNADGSSYSYDYTARQAGDLTLYDMTGVTHADTSTESFIYDANGNPTSHTDRAGNTSTATFNDHGRPLNVTNVAGGITTNTYNPDATLASRTDPASNTTEFAYDLLRRLNLVTWADSHTLSLTQDDADNPLTTTDENGNTVTMTYDANQNLATVEDALFNMTTLAYDGNDRLLSITDPLSGTFSVSFNSIDKLADFTDANGLTTTFGYNKLRRRTSLTDPGNNVWSTSYDVEAIISSATDPLLNTTTFTSDSMGRITRVKSPLGNTSDLAYDAMGRIASSTDALNHTTTFTRDSRGLLSAVSLPGDVISAAYTRNELGNITTVTDPGGNDWHRAYDNMGRLTTRTDPLANTQTNTYDQRNRVATITFPAALGSLTISYDPAGNLTSSSFSDGTLFDYQYDANHRLTSADGITLGYDANNQIIESNGITIVRDAGGRITSMTLAPAKAINYTYDANDRVTSIDDWAGGTTTFSYDAAGRLTTITRPNGVNATRTYDDDSRLTGLMEGSISSISLSRDGNGQIASATRDVPQTATAAMLPDAIYTFDAASQLSDVTYDAMGRLTNAGGNSYTWNLASQLTGKTTASGTTSATYDATGKRISKTQGGDTRTYIWNYALGLASISIEQQNASDLRYYVHTPDGRLVYSMDAISNARRFYHYDEMGNTLFVSNDAGAVIGSYAYTPYGQLIAETGSVDNPFTWQGQYGIMYEGEGLYYIRARYYAANTGRFISRDPLESIDPMEISPYQYALANPKVFVDVSGEKSIEQLAIEFSVDTAKAANLASYYAHAEIESYYRELDAQHEKMINPRAYSAWSKRPLFYWYSPSPLPEERQSSSDIFDRMRQSRFRRFKASSAAWWRQTQADRLGQLLNLKIAEDPSKTLKLFTGIFGHTNPAVSPTSSPPSSAREGNLLHLRETVQKAVNDYNRAVHYGQRTPEVLDPLKEEVDQAWEPFLKAGGSRDEIIGNKLLSVE